MANYNIEEVQKIVDILINADAVMCVSNFNSQCYARGGTKLCIPEWRG